MLKQVLAELIQETPHQLLARELWCGSGSAADWWSFQSGYTSSTAAMSMVTTLRSTKSQTSLHRLLCSSLMHAACVHGNHCAVYEATNKPSQAAACIFHACCYEHGNRSALYKATNKPTQAAVFIFRVCCICAWSSLCTQQSHKQAYIGCCTRLSCMLHMCVVSTLRSTKPKTSLHRLLHSSYMHAAFILCAGSALNVLACHR